MSRRSRRNHIPAFKAKVALAAIKGDRTDAATRTAGSPTPHAAVPSPISAAVHRSSPQQFLTRYESMVMPSAHNCDEWAASC